MFAGVYKGKRVLVTGHTGFKGSWLCMWLLSLGCDVAGYSDKEFEKPNHFNILQMNMSSNIGDVRDIDSFRRVLDAHQPEVVFHLAAQPLVRYSYSNPVETFHTNVIGTVNVLEACRQNGNVKAIINITSDKAYENKEWVWGYRENDPMGGYDPYSASKGAAEIAASAYRSSYFNNDKYGISHNTLLASCRAGNVIGGGDWAEDRLIPDMMRAVSENRPVIIRNPYATRPWQHVLEPLGGYLLVGQKLIEGDKNFAEGWNFGPADEGSINVQQVVENIKKHWSKIDYRIEQDKNALHEANLLKLDCSKAHLKLKWKPVWDSAQTFEKTVGWYREYYENNKCVTEDQLKEYSTKFLKD